MEKLKVLLIDDDKKNVIIPWKHFLYACRCEVITALDGEEGLRLFCQQPNSFPLVIVDFNMPKMNGIETAKEIRLTGIETVLVFHPGMLPENVPFNDDLFNYIAIKGKGSESGKIEKIVATVRQSLVD